MMFSKLSKSSPVRSILVFSLTNLGDAILVCPVVDVLLNDFPSARLSIIVGPKTRLLFEGHPRIDTIVFDKHAKFPVQVAWFVDLWKRRFDVTIDLRQTALSLFLGSQWQTPLLPKPYDGHLRFKHLERLRSVYPGFTVPSEKLSIVPQSVEGIDDLGDYVVIAAGAADLAKVWPAAGFVAVADRIAEKYRVVFVGGKEELDLIEGIRNRMKGPSVSFAGKTTLRQLSYILKNAKYAITHDSGAMHLAGYFDTPVIALFGPTDPYFSAPWAPLSRVLRRNENCLRCQDPRARDLRHSCMSAITVEDVIHAVDQM